MSDVEYSDDGEEFVYDEDDDDEYVYEEEDEDYGAATGAGDIPDSPALMRQASVVIADVTMMEKEMQKVCAAPCTCTPCAGHTAVPACADGDQHSRDPVPSRG